MAYLKSKGYTAVQTGAIMAAISLTSIIGQPFWGNYCDRKNTIRNVLAGCLLVSGIAAFFIPVFFSSFILVFVISLIISFTENSMSSIIDSWTVNTAVKKPWIDYGLTRGLGSLGYAVTALVFGALLDRFGYDLMFFTHFAFVIFAVGFCFYADKTNKIVLTPLAREEGKAKNPGFTLKGSGPYVWLLISSLLVFIGHRATLTFFPVLVKQLDGNNSELGIALFVMALSEVPIMIVSKRIMKYFKDTALIAIAMFFFLVKILLHIFVRSIPLLIAIQLTEAFSYALFLPASVYYIIRIAPEGLSATYLTVAVSVYYGISSIIGSFGGGLVIDQFGIYTMFWIGTALTVMGLLTFLFSTILRPGRRPLEKRWNNAPD